MRRDGFFVRMSSGYNRSWSDKDGYGSRYSDSYQDDRNVERGRQSRHSENQSNEKDRRDNRHGSSEQQQHVASQSSGRKRRSRWESKDPEPIPEGQPLAPPPPPPPPQPATDLSMPVTGNETSNVEKPVRKRKSRWSDDTSTAGALPNALDILSRVQLPSFVRELTGGLELDPEVQALNVRLLDVTKRLQIGIITDERPESERSPSPEPVYDNMGIRVNTREQRARDKLNQERQEIIAAIIKKCPSYKPPADYKPPKLYKKLFIPMKQHPGYNFIGLIIGPRGNTQKRMERETGAKIVIRGKGSMKEGKLNQYRKDLKYDPGENEDLHVLVEADNQESLDKAVGMIEKLLVPDDEALNEHKKAQLRELAALNGTIREEEICRLCGEPGHRQFTCPQKDSTFRSDVSCKICGDGGHPTIDCPQRTSGQIVLDDEYKSFLAELGGGGGSSGDASRKFLEPSDSLSRPGLGMKNRENDERNLYVGYLPSHYEEGDLRNLFAPFGEILEHKVIKDRATGFSKGYGFVLFKNLEDAHSAVQSLNGFPVEGKNLVVRGAGQKGGMRGTAPPPAPLVPPPPPPFPPGYPPPGVPMAPWGGYYPPPGYEVMPPGVEGYASYGGYGDYPPPGISSDPIGPPGMEYTSVPGVEDGGNVGKAEAGNEEVVSEYEKFMSEMGSK